MASKLAVSPLHPPRRPRRALVVLVAGITLVVAASTAAAASGPLETQLAQTRAKQRVAKVKISVKEQRVRQLERQVEDLNGRIRQLDIPIADLTSRIGDLQARIDHRRERIIGLRQEFSQQRGEIVQLGAEVQVARARLAARMVEVYRGEGAADNVGSWATGVQSIGELIRRREALGMLTQSDDDIVRGINDMERQVRVARAHNHDLRASLQAEIAGTTRDQAEVAASRAKLLGQRAQVLALRAGRSQLQRRLESDIGSLREDIDQLDEDAKVLTDVIKNGSSFGGAVPGMSAGGVIWPVNGPIVSGFGMRWGRMHEGVDIAATTGTPIHAAESGIVIYAGWQSGYGNIVIIRHAGVLATAYGHQSRLNSTVGQVVAQGQVIGFVGCTGHCFGPHVHFETRVNGTAVDPMRYL